MPVGSTPPVHLPANLPRHILPGLLCLTLRGAWSITMRSLTAWNRFRQPTLISMRRTVVHDIIGNSKANTAGPPTKTSRSVS
jgi:hypothetical protein